MKTKRILTTLIATLLVTAGMMYAQPGPPPQGQGGFPPGPPPMTKQERKENLEALKVAYITKALDLTVDEAKLFWPVYNAYQDELKALNKEAKENKTEKPIDELTDAELTQLIDDQLAIEQKRVDIKKKYVAEFKKVISTKKIVLLYQAEKKFIKEVLEEFRDKED